MRLAPRHCIAPSILLLLVAYTQIQCKPMEVSQADAAKGVDLIAQSVVDDEKVIGWGEKRCVRKWFPHPNTTRSSSFVCVCDSKHCDEPEPFNPRDVEAGQALVYYVTTKDEHRLHRKSTSFKAEEERTQSGTDGVEIVIEATKTYQTVFGFGAAFTDAAGISLSALSEGAKENLLRAYFDRQTGIGYSTGRVPIASCDFSTHEYSYVEQADDFALETFALASEDLEHKIPYIQRAVNISEGRLQLFASPWSAPGWMKTNGRMKDGFPLKGEINGKYYAAYAEYFKKFFDEYLKLGVKFWGLTLQNEPRNVNWPWQTMDFTFEMQREFASGLLSPALKRSRTTADIKIMGCDDNRGVVLQAAKEIYNDPEKAKAIDGLATHWYDHADFGNLTAAHNVRPDKFLLASEACNGDAPWEHVPLLGDWHRGVMYAHDILNNLRNWVVGWTDWNLCLDLQGGPNWVGNFVDAPIIVNKTNDEFYKQPMFYVMGHFSKFIPRGSIRLESTLSSNDTKLESIIEHVAFTTPEGRRVMVLTNMDEGENRTVEVTIRDAELAGKTATIVMHPNSMVTAIWSATVVRR